MDSQGTEITELLLAVQAGEERAFDRLATRVYDELRGLARGLLRNESPQHTLQATALVHEAWARLASQDSIGVEHRRHFFRVAGNVMRRILVDHARARRSAKRGDGERPVALDATVSALERNAGDLLDLEAGLAELARDHPRKAALIEQRFFLGLEVKESAEVLGISLRQAERDWTLARAWLRRRFGPDPGERATDGD